VATCIGIALFGSEVSPRFCFADAILVVEADRGKERRRFIVSLGEAWLPGRVAELAAHGVRTLLCGAFNRAFLPTAERLGIRVITGVSGSAEEALTQLLHGRGPAGTKMRRGQRLSSPPR
jgi:predicted Fe-Mo cluster-binding NifX family protein